jgi:membrane protease YdiL (CAAX protease family)
MQLKGEWASSPPFNKFLILTGLIIIATIVLSVAGNFISVMLFGVNFLSEPLALNNLEDPDVLNSAKILQGFTSIGTFIVPSFVFAFLVSFAPASFLGIDRSANRHHFILAVLVLLSALPAINFLVSWNESIQLPDWLNKVEDWMKTKEETASEVIKKFLAAPDIPTLLFNLVLIAVLPAIGEELLFRGVIQKLFWQWFGNIHAAIIMAAVVFSFFHLQFYGFFPRVALGIVLGYMFYWSGSLWVPILAHFFNNGMAVTAEYLMQHNHISEDFDTAGTAPDELPLVISSFLFAGFLIFLFYKTRRSEKETIEQEG